MDLFVPCLDRKLLGQGLNQGSLSPHRGALQPNSLLCIDHELDSGIKPFPHRGSGGIGVQADQACMGKLSSVALGPLGSYFFPGLYALFRCPSSWLHKN